MAVAGWSSFSNRYYRKQEIYRMAWQSIQLSGHKVACARFGGPIAIVRDESKIVQLRAEPARPKLLIFTSSGMPLASVDRPSGRLIAMGWSDEEELLCVMEDGNIFRYDVHGQHIQPSLSFGKECWEQGIVDCIVWGNGLVCLTESNQLFCIQDLSSPQAVKLASPNLEKPPLCMTIIEPEHTVSGHVEVLLATEEAVLSVDVDIVQDLGATTGPIQKMAASPNGSFVACFSYDGRLLVMSSDFTKSIAEEFDTQSALPPEQLIWCGMDSVLLYWEESLLMVGPYGDYEKYSYDEPLVLIPECDGVRILSNSYMEFLHRVPDSTVSIFSVGSTSPAAMLYDAFDHFEKRNAKADENIRFISSSLPEAVESCIDAAGHEFDLQTQKTLMHAAAYGRAFCSKFPKGRFMETCRTLRVLNAVRSAEVGIPLTIQQLKVLTLPVLIARLINAYRHLLALRVSDFVGLSTETVLVHWACTSITGTPSVPDGPMLEMIVEKLKTCPGLSYASIAAHAYKNGRRKLAALLLDYEPRSSEQVPLLTKMGEEEKALVKATESGDTDLVYFTIFHLWQQKSPAEFFRGIQAKPLARDLFISYARQHEPEVLKKFFASTGQLHRVAEIILWESWLYTKNPGARQGSPLQGPRLRLIEEAQDLYSQTREHSLEAKACEEHIRLLKMQLELEAATAQAIFFDSSVSDTIRTCIVLGNHRAAQKFRVEFKVPEKRFYWLKVLGLATARNWDALEKFSKEKRPPIGYKPFADACIQEGQAAEARKYIVKLDPQDQEEAYRQIGMNDEADAVASQHKESNELLGRLRFTFGQSTAASALFDTIRDKLSLQKPLLSSEFVSHGSIPVDSLATLSLVTMLSYCHLV